MPMQPYDPQAKCPKCWGDDVGAIYHETDRFEYLGCPSCQGNGSPEHIRRDCRRCGYAWAEACLTKENP